AAEFAAAVSPRHPGRHPACWHGSSAVRRGGAHAVRTGLPATAPTVVVLVLSRSGSANVRSSYPAHRQACAAPGAPHHRRDDVPRDGDGVLVGEGGGRSHEATDIDWPASPGARY